MTAIFVKKNNKMCEFWMWIFILIFIVSTTEVACNENINCSSSRVNSSKQFRCQSGSGCVGWDQVCDLIQHCADASDEAYCLHSSRRKRANPCILPPYPEHGTYETVSDKFARPGQSRDSFVLKLKCRRGFGVINSDGTDGNSTTVYCVNGVWSQPMPKCVRFCKLDSDASIYYMCHVPGAGFKVCNNHVAPGTLANPICRTPIYYSTESFPYMKCVAGFWDYFAQCKAECGRLLPEGFGLIIGGKEVKRGELPWHAGIYRKTSNTYTQICGGSMISNNAVISAAHCFWGDVTKLLPASDYAVAIGKIYRSWDSDGDVGAQKSDIKEIKIPRLFEGTAANFQEDIAILILEAPFVYNAFVRPICLNFDANFEKWQLQHGTLGKVAGWGVTTANGLSSPILLVIEIPFINEETCIKDLPLTFREYITGDKFCAGYTNGTALCRGDSGGGLAFVDRELGRERYYLRGIVSTAPKKNDNICNPDTYTTFTKITKHQAFIKETLAAFTRRPCPLYSFQCDDGSCVDQGADCNGKQDCKDGSDEAEELCSLGGNTNIIPLSSGACVLPPYPNRATYIVSNAPNAVPGQSFDSFVLTVICSTRYAVMDSEDGAHEISAEVYCVEGVWLQDMPKCVLACEWEGLKGRCIPSRLCLSTLDRNLPKQPVCAQNSEEVSICCTDCGLDNDTSYYVTTPDAGVFWKDGRKARDVCLQYLREVPHRCHQEGYTSGVVRHLNKEEKCHSTIPFSMPPKDPVKIHPSQHPYEALMGYGESILSVRWTTAGTIITNNFILAASVGINDANNLKFVASGVKKETNQKNYQVQAVKKIYRHPLFEDGSMYHDIALVELETPFVFNDDVLPACLPEPTEALNITKARFHNWKAKTTEMMELQEVPNKDCYDRLMVTEAPIKMYYKSFLPRKVHPNSHLCYGEKGKCANVFGGALVVDSPYSSCMNTVIGLNTYGLYCDVTVFTKVQYYMPWIESIVWP